MQDSVFVHVAQASNGCVFGVDREGVLTQFRRSGVRKLVTSLRGASDFDDCDVDAVYLPTPPPAFAVEALDVSDDARGVLLRGETSFGAVRLDRRRVGGSSGGWEVPFKQLKATEGADVVTVKWMPGNVGSFCVLRRDGTLTVHDSAAPEFAARSYRLRRHEDDGIGISVQRRAPPADLAFLPPCIPWGRFCAVVLYRDGALFTLCPVLPAQSHLEEIIEEAEKQSVSEELLTGLAMEMSDGTEEREMSYVLELHGPVNGGLKSEWEESHIRGRGDSAVALMCAGSESGCVTVAIGTASGVIYHHLWTEDVSLQMTLSPDPAITTLGVRICPGKDASVKVRLVEVIHVGGDRREKQKMQLWQNCWHPELMYCRQGANVYRVQFGWVTQLLEGTLGEGPLQGSEIWKFARDAECLGSFHDLDASVAVFRHEYRTTASIFRHKILTASSVVPLEPSFASKSDFSPETCDDLREALAEVDDPAFAPVQQAFQRYEESKEMEDYSFVDTLEKLQDESAALQERTSEMESVFDSLTPQTGESLRLIRECTGGTWSKDSCAEQFKATTAWLNDVSEKS